MSSLYLNRLSSSERDNLIKVLHGAQRGSCFICGKEIDLVAHKDRVDIDHVIPLASKGKDDPLLSRNSRNVAMPADLITGRFAIISLIRIQESLPSSGKSNNDPGKQSDKLSDVMSIGPCNGQRQRDATPVHQYVALGSFFSPGPSDSARLLPAQGEL